MWKSAMESSYHLVSSEKRKYTTQNKLLELLQANKAAKQVEEESCGYVKPRLRHQNWKFF